MSYGKYGRQTDDGVVTLIVVVLFTIIITAFSYTQRYVENKNDTATKGLWFTTTIDLKKYNQIGEGHGLFGKYDVVTRSVIQGDKESVRIYK